MVPHLLDLLFACSWVLGCPAGQTQASVAKDKPRLRLTSSGTFKVAVFSDLHFGEAEDQDWGPLQDVKSTKVMSTILDIEKPNFVVFNGDLITGENTFKENATKYLDQVVGPAVQRAIPFASTYGNHDNDVNVTHALLLERERSQWPTLSYTSSTPGVGGSDGPANYFVPVYASASGPPTFLLWFFDSRAGKAYGTGTELQDWVDVSVAKWVTTTASTMRATWGSVPPSLAFVHIPTNVSLAYQKAFVTTENGGDSSKIDPDRPGLRFPGLNDDIGLAAQDQEGYYHSTYQGEDAPFVASLKASLGKSLFALVSGHDHGDAWCARGPLQDDLTVCFGRHSGYGGYGSWKRGGRIFEFTRGRTVLPTWNRMEDGTVIDKVSLDDRFGR